MKKILMIGSALASIFGSGPCVALTYDFSFSDAIGTITGHVDGLSPGYSGPVSDVYIDSAPAGFMLTPPTNFFIDPTQNNFVVDASGDIVSYDLYATYQVYALLQLSSSCDTCSYLDSGFGPVITSTSFPFPTGAGSTSAAPIPSSAVLFATLLGLGALWGWSRRSGSEAGRNLIGEAA